MQYNSNEGSLFTPTGINTEQDFDNYLNSYLPSVSHWNKQLLKTFYPSTHDTNSSLLDYDTSGYREHPNVNSMSDWANGQQQRAFVRPSSPPPRPPPSPKKRFPYMARC